LGFTTLALTLNGAFAMTINPIKPIITKPTAMRGAVRLALSV